MRTTRRVTAGLTVAVAASLGAATLLGSSAQAASTMALGHKSLAAVLTSDGNRFDHNSRDFDIVTEAVLAVLAAKPHSPVSVLTKGRTALTAFVPTARAFEKLASGLAGTKITSERKAFNTVAGLGIDTVETVLLYHVVPGATITAKQALASDGANLTTAQGGTVKVLIRGGKNPSVWLRDKDPDFRDAQVVAPDINRGNRQIAHGVNRVLLPLNI